MEREIGDDVACSSVAVDSIIRIGTGGVIWGLCASPYDAKQIGLTGSARASFVAKSVGRFGLQCGLFAGIFSFSRCGIRKYRREDDWINALIAGGVAGAAVSAGTRNLKQVTAMAGVLSIICAVAEKTIV